MDSIFTLDEVGPFGSFFACVRSRSFSRTITVLSNLARFNVFPGYVHVACDAADLETPS